MKKKIKRGLKKKIHVYVWYSMIIAINTDINLTIMGNLLKGFWMSGSGGKILANNRVCSIISNGCARIIILNMKD